MVLLSTRFRMKERIRNPLGAQACGGSNPSISAKINAHFRYQLRKVDYEVCILAYMRVLYPFMFWIWGQNVNTNLSDSIDIKSVDNTDSPG